MGLFKQVTLKDIFSYSEYIINRGSVKNHLPCLLNEDPNAWESAFQTRSPSD